MNITNAALYNYVSCGHVHVDMYIYMYSTHLYIEPFIYQGMGTRLGHAYIECTRLSAKLTLSIDISRIAWPMYYKINVANTALQCIQLHDYMYMYCLVYHGMGTRLGHVHVRVYMCNIACTRLSKLTLKNPSVCEGLVLIY